MRAGGARCGHAGVNGGGIMGRMSLMPHQTVADGRPATLRRALLVLAAAGLATGAATAQTMSPMSQPTPSSDVQALLAAANAGDVAAIGRALDAGAPIESRDTRGRTPVLLATHGGHTAAAQLLMMRGANVNAQDDQRDSAFLLAGARGRTEIVRAAPTGASPTATAARR